MKLPSFAAGLAPKEAIAYLQAKGYNLSFDYNEMSKEAHHKAFTVAKVMRLDLLNDIHGSITDAMQNGTRFEDWKKALIPTLEKKGWWGQQNIINPKTGEVKEITINSSRLNTIFKTNTRVAMATARYEQQMQGEHNIYWEYIGGLSEHPRMEHKRKNGTTLLRTDPWWQTNYPPNAFGCHCNVRAWSAKQLERQGKKLSTEPQEDIATKDWAYNPGAGNRVAKIAKIDLDKSLKSLPTIMPKKSYTAYSDEALKKKFYEDLSIKSGAMYVDKVGDPMVVDDNLFTASGFGKITKKDRHFYVDAFANVLSDPDEIYLEWDEKAGRLVKKMFSYYQDEKGRKRAVMAIFEYLPDKTQGVSIYYIDTDKSVESRRKDKLIYVKEPHN